ncbi:type II toxin-antitoxin system YafQ family toxin [Limosilactobacillus pontis]|uniref:type II toxin-antitoxin system YafQ family toxin n=1 Tax=Limosilactobacillus pontis TaxID=35787 RepID=UPI00070C85E5|nr:type II toxin-antitoxin system YafQ family toxin [Limosilactobacillus pontis]QFV01091.1 type II toxin-antitoxin system mRNA interferase toxin, RelE/StbE family [Limosilactobacillus pontis]
MYQLKIEAQFKRDYKNLKRRHPELIRELMNTLKQLQINGIVNSKYRPYILNNRGGNYNGSYEYHLSDGRVDILVIYMPHKTNPTIRLIRVGSHNEVFHSDLR